MSIYEYTRTVERFQQLHRSALVRACDKLEMSLAEYGRRIGVKDRQTIHAWMKHGRIPVEYLQPVSRDSGYEVAELAAYPRRPYGTSKA